MSNKLEVGGVEVPGRVWIAPMTGVSDLPFRETATALGAPYVATEMVACAEFARGRPDVVRRAAVGEGLPLMVVQLVGRDIELMARGARMAAEAGAEIIDLNFGCPAKEVSAGQQSGSALMREPDLAEALVAAAVAAVDVPVTVKMRLGWDDASRNAPELARRAVSAGARMITVHGRTRQQFYKGVADWAAIRAVRAAGDFPLVANGDIHDLTDARTCLSQSGADFVMVGRAALGRPWLVGAIGAQLAGRTVPELTLAQKLAMAREHYEGLLSLMGQAHGVRHARKHLAAYADDAVASGGVADQDQRRILLTSDQPRQVIEALTHLFSPEYSRAAA